MNVPQALLRPLPSQPSVAQEIPLTVPDSVLWLHGQKKLKNAVGSFPTNTQNIAEWKSFGSPIEHLAIQETDANRPSYLDNALDSIGGSTFVAADTNYLTITDPTDLDFANGDNFTMFLAGTVDIVTATSFFCAKAAPGDNVASAGDYGFDWFFSSTGTRPNFRIRANPDDTLVQCLLGVGDALSADEDFILAVRMDWSANIEHWKNGGVAVTTDVSTLTGSLATAGDFNFGCRGSGNDPIDSKIMEFIVYRRKLTDVQLNLVGNYIGDKYTSLSWTDV